MSAIIYDQFKLAYFQQRLSEVDQIPYEELNSPEQQTLLNELEKIRDILFAATNIYTAQLRCFNPQEPTNPVSRKKFEMINNLAATQEQFYLLNHKIVTTEETAPSESTTVHPKKPIRYGEFAPFFFPRIEQLERLNFSEVDSRYLNAFHIELEEMKNLSESMIQLMRIHQVQRQNDKEKADGQHAKRNFFSQLLHSDSHETLLKRLQRENQETEREIQSFKALGSRIEEIEKKIPLTGSAPSSIEPPSFFKQMKLLVRDKGGLFGRSATEDRPPSYNPHAEFPEVRTFLESLKIPATIAVLSLRERLLS